MYSLGRPAQQKQMYLINYEGSPLLPKFVYTENPWLILNFGYR
jgi:hypothetical protein